MSQEQGSARGRSKVGWILGLAAIAVILAFLAIVVAPKLIHSGPQPSVSAAEARIECQGASCTWNQAVFTDGSPMKDDELREAVFVGLRDVNNLLAWQLCATELHAEFVAEHGVMLADKMFPRDMPNNITPGAYATYVVASEKWAAAVEQAKVLAKNADIPCSQGDGSPRLRIVEITFTLGSQQRTARVSDYDVMRLALPLERYEHTGTCASKLQTDRDAMVNRPLDTVVPNIGKAFSEQQKQRMLFSYDARIELLKHSKLTNC